MGEEHYVANELLAFLQQKLDVMDEVSAVQICKSNFTEDDISAAKTLLFRSVNKLDQMVSRRRDGTQKSIQDIITLLKETDPDDVPTFVARDLNKLPPVIFDHVDVTCLLKDIVALKASMAKVMLKFEASQNDVSELRKEVNDLRASLALCRSLKNNDPNVNTHNRASVTTPGSSCKSAISTPPPPPPALPSSGRCDAASAPLAAPAPASARCPLPPPPRTPPTPLTPNAQLSSRRSFAAIAATCPQKKADMDNRSTRADLKAHDDDGFIPVLKKKPGRRVIQNRCGTAPTGPNFLLRAATRTTAMYLSRLHHTSTVQDVTEYIKKKTNTLLRVQLLESRHNASFKAFVVRVPTTALDTYMKEDFWPKGVVYRRFRGRLPTAATETAPN